jgi:hypothetical protein
MLRSRARRARNISAILLFVSLAGIVAALVFSGSDVPQESAALAPLENAPAWGFPFAPESSANDLALAQNSGSVYPYSIIPGGVSNARDLKLAIARDPVVASHYSGFDPAKARVIRLNKELAAYVSYRMGNKVYWTSRKLVLHAGENIITDGLHSARTRCGNRISEAPVKPVNSMEPMIPELETPEPGVLSSHPESPLAPWINSGPVFNPPIVPVFFGGGSPSHPSHDPPPTNPVPPVTPPTPVPEPSTLFLLATGISASLALRRKIKLPK